MTSSVSSSSQSETCSGRKRRLSSDSEYEVATESDSDTQTQSASKSYLHDLENRGIFCDKEPVDLSEIWGTLKEDEYIDVVEEPNVIKIFDETMRQCLHFSVEIDSIIENKLEDAILEGPWKWFDFRSRRLDESKNRVMELCCWKSFNTILEDFSISLSEVDCQICSRLLYMWFGYAIDFIGRTKDLLMSVAHATDSHIEENVKRIEQKLPSVPDSKLADSYVQDAQYRELIMVYSRLFFLDPRPGEISKTKKDVKCKIVGCIPDVRYERNIPVKKNLVHFIEVKRSALRKIASSNNLVQTMKSDVLGQVGAELLEEMQNSFFRDSSVGILCMRTEIIFVVLNISKTHNEATNDGSNFSGKKGRIMYTRSYDILKAEDRKEMLEFLFWLTFLQRGALSEFYGFNKKRERCT